MQTAECVVVGAGVIGLAIGRALAMRGLETILLDAESRIGSGISSRSSEVIHAGLYYPPGSLKNIFCIEGRRQLYHFCEARGVPYRRCGKLVVATSPQEIAALETLEASAVANSIRSEEHTSELQSLMRISYAVFCLKKKHTSIMNKTS